MCFHLSILRVCSVKTQLIYCQLKWRHVSTQSHHQANYWYMFKVHQVKVHIFWIPNYYCKHFGIPNYYCKHFGIPNYYCKHFWIPNYYCKHFGIPNYYCKHFGIPNYYCKHFGMFMFQWLAWWWLYESKHVATLIENKLVVFWLNLFFGYFTFVWNLCCCCCCCSISELFSKFSWNFVAEKFFVTLNIEWI